ncbi:pseudouridine synthase [Zychaea mexicana]|uniref:pseudouridine synthase n=1 Tax=Zychaea mexicana TaxID=64656 RepID=UPI0022FDF9D1|nr:pseudouridine synthase [Zychaea mexicana]KAI9498294.1 pseudouridine synthase [Zychaea mexicana]
MEAPSPSSEERTQQPLAAAAAATATPSITTVEKTGPAKEENAEVGQKRKATADSDDPEQQVQDQEKEEPQQQQQEQEQPNPKQQRIKRPKGRSEKDFREKNDISNAEYIVEDGLRRVKPYFFEYKAYAKGRWMQRSLINVFTEEFQDRNEKYYRHAMELGLITINGETVGPDHIVKNNDILGHKIHRHEPVVTGKPIEIVHRSNDLIVINKPGGIPIHPAGRYRHNTVIHVMRKTLGIERLFPANRLDRPTSGLMLVGLNSEKARQLEAEMISGQIQKEYVCRVVGEFPQEEIVCEEPLKTISYKLSLNYVHGDGKASKTIFKRLSYNGKTSVVWCRPRTGRTHQIRVHLRYLGYPIANDPIYGNGLPWSDLIQKGQTLDEEGAEKVVQKVIEVATFPEGMWEDTEDKDGVKQIKPRCDECGLVLTEDPSLKELCIWLHAWKYSGPSWAYETALPDWADASFTEEGESK